MMLQFTVRVQRVCTRVSNHTMKKTVDNIEERTHCRETHVTLNPIDVQGKNQPTNIFFPLNNIINYQKPLKKEKNTEKTNLHYKSERISLLQTMQR